MQPWNDLSTPGNSPCYSQHHHYQQQSQNDLLTKSHHWFFLHCLQWQIHFHSGLQQWHLLPNYHWRFENHLNLLYGLQVTVGWWWKIIYCEQWKCWQCFVSWGYDLEAFCFYERVITATWLDRDIFILWIIEYCRTNSELQGWSLQVKFARRSPPHHRISARTTAVAKNLPSYFDLSRLHHLQPCLHCLQWDLEDFQRN